MLISHRKRFIYTKTVKTAGTSVESYFEKYCMPEGSWEFTRARAAYIGDCGIIGHRGSPPPEGCDWFNHMSAESIRARAGEAVWNSYFKFCVIRNPFEKVVSAFYFFESPGTHEGASPPAIAMVDRFRSWVAAGNAQRCFDRDKYLIDGALCLDFLIRYESIEAGLSEVCHRLQIPFDISEVPRLKASNRDRKIKIAEFYGADTIDIVRKLFAFELHTFAYDMPS